MTNRQPIPTDALLVALDIAKVRNEVLIEAPNHKRRRRLSVLNTRAEHDRLIETLRAYGEPVICAFEATGNYHRPIAWRLIEAGFDVRLVSSMALARTREALHNAGTRTIRAMPRSSFTCYGSARRNVTMTRSGPG
jgi:transposase